MLDKPLPRSTAGAAEDQRREIPSGTSHGQLGQFDLFDFRRQTLQQRLNRPGFALTDALPKQRCRLFGGALLDQGGIETLLKPQPAASSAGWIARLPRLPAESISCREVCFGVAGLTRFEFAIFRHWPCPQFACCRREVFERRAVWMGAWD